MQNITDSKQCKTCNMNLSEDLLSGFEDCYFCTKYKKKWLGRDYPEKERELKKILDFYKVKHKHDKYDCIVPLSGGKDSSYVLYLAVKKFGMRPLSLTFNNGFQTALARKNIKNAVAKLKTGHINIAYNKEELRKMYSVFFNKTKNICTVCNHLINTSIFQTAEKEKISLIIAGGVSKLELAPIYGNKRYCMEDIFLKVLDGEVNFDLKKYCNKQIRMNNKIEFITLFNYFDYNYTDVLNVLKNELDWNESVHGDAKVDCEFHPVISYFKFLNNGTSSSLLMASSLLRDKKITIDEYNRRMKNVFNEFKNIEKAKIKEFFDYLNTEESTVNKNFSLLNYVESLIQEEDFNEFNKLKYDNSMSTSQKIEKLFEVILPELQRDGIVLEIMDFKDSELKILPKGHCRSCLQTDDTLLPWLEAVINEHISEDITIERFIRLE
ncbi:MAG: NifU family protein [bacterium]